MLFSFLLFGCANPCPGPLVCLWAQPPEERPFTVVTYGTSLTADGAWVGAVSAELAAQYGEVGMFVNSAESARSSVWAVENFDARVLAHDPSLVFLEFAVNDAYTPFMIDLAASRANLEWMLDQLELNVPDAAVVLIVSNYVIGDGAAARPELAAYYEGWRVVAAERGLTVVDEEVAWEALYARSPETFEQLVPDGLHPSYEGHDLVNRPLILDTLRGTSTDIEALVSEAVRAAAE